MTGTAATEADEFLEIYNLDVVEIPTNRPSPASTRTTRSTGRRTRSYKAVIREIEAASAKGQPILVGTTSIEKSEHLADLLIKDGFTLIDFENPQALEPLYRDAREGAGTKHFAVLNARFHEQEAFIVAEAGVPGAITIATNMAGRGTDIQLGGNAKMRIERELAGLEGEERAAKEKEILDEVADFKEKALAAGGLYVLGTERHESRRIDNQLRGRSGRQGDPGPLQVLPVAPGRPDAHLRLRPHGRHAAQARPEGRRGDHPPVDQQGDRAGAGEGRGAQLRHPQEHPEIRQRHERPAQGRVRAAQGVHGRGERARDHRRHAPRRHRRHRRPRHPRERLSPSNGTSAGLKENVLNFLNLDLPIEEWAKEEGIADEEIRERLQKAADEAYAQRVEANSAEVMNYVEKQVLLQSLDHLWREHLVTLDHLRQVIGWRGIAQRDPLNEYKSEAFELFNALIGHLREQVTGQLMRIEVVFQQPEPQELPPMFAQHLDPATGENEFDLAQGSGFGAGSALAYAAAAPSTPVEARDPNDPSSWGRVGRNEPCPQRRQFATATGGMRSVRTGYACSRRIGRKRSWHPTGPKSSSAGLHLSRRPAQRIGYQFYRNHSASKRARGGRGAPDRSPQTIGKARLRKARRSNS